MAIDTNTGKSVAAVSDFDTQRTRIFFNVGVNHPNGQVGHGAPTSTPPLGSLYIDENAGTLYVYQSTGWVAK